LFVTWFPKNYVKNLKKKSVKKKVVYCMWNDVIGASFLELNDEYYFLSYVYNGDEKEIEGVFVKYYSLLQVLCGELGLGYWEKGVRNVGFYADEDWLPLIGEYWGSISKVRDGYYLYQFNSDGRRIVNDYAELCKLEVVRRAPGTIERRLVDWDKII
jgi:hypothetical protein